MKPLSSAQAQIVEFLETGFNLRRQSNNYRASWKLYADEIFSAHVRSNATVDSLRKLKILVPGKAKPGWDFLELAKDYKAKIAPKEEAIPKGGEEVLELMKKGGYIISRPSGFGRWLVKDWKEPRHLTAYLFKALLDKGFIEHRPELSTKRDAVYKLKNR